MIGSYLAVFQLQNFSRKAVQPKVKKKITLPTADVI
jgi:hypothetical protein